MKDKEELIKEYLKEIEAETESVLDPYFKESPIAIVSNNTMYTELFMDKEYHLEWDTEIFNEFKDFVSNSIKIIYPSSDEVLKKYKELEMIHMQKAKGATNGNQ